MHFKLSLAILLIPFLSQAVPQCALVTGVSRGIGYALAKNLLSRGISVVGVARAAEAQMQELLSHQQFAYLSADLSSPAGLAAFDNFIHTNTYSFDIVIHNAAIIDPACLEDADAESLEKVIAINLLAPMKLTRILTDCYRPRARIACMSSGAATYPIEQLGAYCISKAGLAMFVEMLRVEYAYRNIAVASIMPGIVDTDMQQMLREHAKGDIQAQFQALYDQGELSTPSECADYIAWLVCDVPFEYYKEKGVWNIDER